MDTFEAVKNSFARCGESDGFYDTFYEVFLGKSPEIPPLFAKTDFKKQKQVLKATVALMVAATAIRTVAAITARTSITSIRGMLRRSISYSAKVMIGQPLAPVVAMEDQTVIATAAPTGVCQR